ncbi:myosin heavy chain, striated muscle-like isoform X1 [Leptidea sinapis]|uniref:myosin heavy chain, striated muscle-like isoform X1 n=1 Tax=Leptidea sinapis TaxID=189913 RepID=UPI00212243AD|nr:myosin heavy chain, striated muscle-like isoform X1 [Leptidea sinapis]
MLQPAITSNHCPASGNNITEKPVRNYLRKRAASSNQIPRKPRVNSPASRTPAKERRCQSLSPSGQIQKPKEYPGFPSETVSAPDKLSRDVQDYMYRQPEKDITLPQCVVSKTLRNLAIKKREFLKLKKTFLVQQNSFLEQYAALKDLEARSGVHDDSLGEIRIVTLSGWPAYDLLLLVRDDFCSPRNTDISGVFGPQVLQQLDAQLNPIPGEVLSMGAEIMARRMELLNLLRNKHRGDRASYHTNLEWKTKNVEFDAESENLHRLVAGTAENLKSKITYCLDLAKVPWLDREAFIKRVERVQKENSLLQHKIEEMTKKEDSSSTKGADDNISQHHQALYDELAKEKAARESLKEVVSSAEGMLRVARARVATLERQLKDTRSELEATRKKHKELEQLYRHRESSYDARSKKLMEMSKTGEAAIEALSRQRDALELRVRELHEQVEQGEREVAAREAQEMEKQNNLLAKVAEQVKRRETAESRVKELEGRVKELEEQLNAIREKSMRLVDVERRRCLEYVPCKESEPTDAETEIWKELQVTKISLSRAEEELRQSRADKESFLNSLSKIAQEEGADKGDKLAAELLSKERKILSLHRIIDEQKENEKLMEQSMTEYENQLASLRLEIKKLKNYDCYVKDSPYQDLQTELLELHMQVETLSRERSALVSAAASRALMLERHERAADLFARMTRVRRELAAHLEGKSEPAAPETDHLEMSRSLSSICASAADTWSALRAERTRVLRLESAVLAQSLQLEREERVRTQLERRKTVLEREIFRMQHVTSRPKFYNSQNSSIFHD